MQAAAPNAGFWILGTYIRALQANAGCEQQAQLLVSRDGQLGVWNRLLDADRGFNCLVRAVPHEQRLAVHDADVCSPR